MPGWRTIGAAAALALLAACGHEVRRTSYAGGRPWSEVRYQHGVPDGVWRTWWENGQTKSEGPYRAGERHGAWRTWFADGVLQTEELYAAGRPAGTWRHWYANGQLESEGTYAGGVKSGAWREWFGDGTLKAEAEFKDGIATGSATVYFPDGRPSTHTRYDAHGHAEYMEVFNPGREWWSRMEGPIANDRRNGEWKVYNLDGTLNDEHSGNYVDDVLQRAADEQ